MSIIGERWSGREGVSDIIFHIPFGYEMDLNKIRKSYIELK